MGTILMVPIKHANLRPLLPLHYPHLFPHPAVLNFLEFACKLLLIIFVHKVNTELPIGHGTTDVYGFDISRYPFIRVQSVNPC